jgi:molybdenum cofactor cytidylyltransferase
MIATIVLAAGQSTRMGAHKLLLPLGDRPVLAHVVDAALASRLRPVIVVLGYDAVAVGQVVSGRDIQFALNERFADGLSTSVRAGLDALPASVGGVVIALGDQPGVTAAQLDALAALAADSGAPIVVSSYAGQRGNPVYFARSCFGELRAVTGDSGGRQVIARHDELVRELPVDDVSVSEDLDTPADYQRLLPNWPRNTAPHA